jgi:hypothetical protein
VPDDWKVTSVESTSSGSATGSCRRLFYVKRLSDLPGDSRA